MESPSKTGRTGGQGHWTDTLGGALTTAGQFTPFGSIIGPLSMINKGLFGNRLGLLGAFMDDKQGGLFRT